jgi:probable O-glycosylation ligase (exosortase A-associated)
MGGLRDLAMFVIVFGAIPYILRHPYIGVIVWSWLSYMNPHRLTWGVAYNFPFAQVVAIAMLVALVFDKEPKRLPKHGLVVIWVLFIIWMLITTMMAFRPESAWLQFVKVFKIQLIIFLTMLIMHSPERIKLMVWTIYLSLGFYGIKGGIFTIETLGAYRVYGPFGSFIEDNNHLAIALLMALPLGVFLVRHQAQNKWLRIGLWASIALIALAVVASYSRGAFLSIICVAIYLWWKTEKKMITGLLILPLLPLIFLAMPESWHERMASIQNYEQDASAMGRLNAWTYAVNVANDNITGAGMQSWTSASFAIYAPDPSMVVAAHSIYFSVIADHGWIGLLFFLTIFIGGFVVAGRVARVAGTLNDYRWISDLAKMIQVSLVAYGTGGTFLSMSYFDLPWHLVAIALLLRQLLEREGVWETRQKPFAASSQAPRVSP